MPALRCAAMSVGAHVVAQARAAGADRLAQRVLDGFRQARTALEREAIGARSWIDAGAKKALARVDVADAHHAPPVHQKELDGGAMRAREGEKASRVERSRERLDPQVGNQRVRVHRSLSP